MNTASDPVAPSWLRDLLATAWPPAESGDSDLQRRRKAAVRGGQVAMMVLVAAAVIATFAPEAKDASLGRVTALSAAGLAYILWSVHGMRGVVRRLLCCEPARPEAIGLNGARLLVYFTVQFGLAQLMYLLGDRGRVTAVMWLVLLPPVAHSVILLSRGGVIVVCAAAVTLFLGNMLRWYEWTLVQNATLAFSFSVLFTVVFTSLAVTAEQSRRQVAQLAAELTEANRKLREHAVQAEELAATRERNRLAREIHDSLGHYLTVVNVQLEAARAVYEHEPARALEALHKAQAFTQQGLQQVRSSVASLRAAPLERKTLAQALQDLVDESNATGLATSLEVRSRERALSPQAQLTFFRAAQEGLTNVRKHAQAASARLTLDYSAPDAMKFELSDDGRGASGAEGGFGLIGLRERVALLNGTFEIVTAPGAGFAIRIELPA